MTRRPSQQREHLVRRYASKRSPFLTPEKMACINSLIGTKLSSRRQVYIRRGALSHPCTGGGIDFFFFFFPFLQEEHLLKCASAELPSRHERGGDTRKKKRKDAEEEASKVTACSIKNTHLQYMSLEEQAATIGIFFCVRLRAAWRVQHLRKHQLLETGESGAGFASVLRGFRAITALKGAAAASPAGFKRRCEPLLCEHLRVRVSPLPRSGVFTAALTLWLVYLSTRMAEGLNVWSSAPRISVSFNSILG